MDKINQLMNKYLDDYGLSEQIQFVLEAEWKNLPAGWDKKSVEKFAKSLASKAATETGFFDACVEKMKGNIDDPEAFCATVKDTVWGTTYWRGKDKSKADIKKAKKAGK